MIQLIGYFEPAKPGQPVQAVPGGGLDVGQSGFWAPALLVPSLPLRLGCLFAFASHFAPAMMEYAVALYRRAGPDHQYILREPYVMLGVNVFAADTDAEARRLFSSLQQAFLNLRNGHPGEPPPPVDDLDAHLPPRARTMLRDALACSIVGAAETVRARYRNSLAAYERRRIDGQYADIRSRGTPTILRDFSRRQRQDGRCGPYSKVTICVRRKLSPDAIVVRVG